MATTPNRPPREVVEFPPNIPVPVSLKYGQGKPVASQYDGPNRFMFSLLDGRVIFVDAEVANQISALGIKPGESFQITKRTDGRRDSPVAWLVARAIGEQPNGTFVAPALPVIPGGRDERTLAALEAARAEALARLDEITRKQQAVVSTPVDAKAACVKPNADPVAAKAKAPLEEPPAASALEDALKIAVRAAHAAGEYAKLIGYLAMPQFTSEDLAKMAMTCLISSEGRR
jgi:hypothetical protein